MDPYFLQHTIADVSTRFATTLIFLLGFSVFIYSTLQLIFKTKLYNKWLGKGWTDGGESKPSKVFPGCDPRAWISMLIGIVFAWGLNLNFAFQLIGMTDASFFAGKEGMSNLGVWDLLSPGLMVFLSQAITGIAIGAGPKFLIGISNTFASARDAILARINPV